MDMETDELGIYYWYMYLLDDSLITLKKDQKEQHSDGQRSPRKDDIEANAGVVSS